MAIQRPFKQFMTVMVQGAILILMSMMGWIGVGVCFPDSAWGNPIASTTFEPVFLFSTLTSETGSKSSGSVLFETNCAGCHPKGGNIIKRGKTLKLKPLTKRHLDSVDAIATLVTNGKGLMSAYGETLTPEEIQTVSAYVWDQAQRNWKP